MLAGYRRIKINTMKSLIGFDMDDKEEVREALLTLHDLSASKDEKKEDK